MGILLFNIIAGLMLDAFAEIREEADKRDDILSDTCFVCGMERKEYDNLHLPPSYPSFDQHKEQDHDGKLQPKWTVIF